MQLLPWQSRLDSVLRSWVGTAYAPGQCSKGGGADCRYFVVGVLDELYRVTQPIPPRLPQDTGQFNRAAALASIRQISTRYPCEMIDPRSQAEPGDVLIVRPPASHPNVLQHVMIAGVGKPMPLWHSAPGGVCRTVAVNWIVARIFRTLNKESWSE